VVYEEISQHRAAQGPADERGHRVSQGRVPLSQPKVRKILDTTRTAARSAPSRGAAAATQVNSSYLNPFVSNAQADGSTAGFANCATTAALINSLDSRFSVCISPNGNGMSAYATSRHLYQSE
jgi:hypothetical protein